MTATPSGCDAGADPRRPGAANPSRHDRTAVNQCVFYDTEITYL